MAAANRPISVRIQGLDEVQKKLKYDVLADDAVGEAFQKLSDRPVKRRGRGLGAERNELEANVENTGAVVTSTLVYPRTEGTAWTRKNVRAVRGMSRNVMNKAVRQIEARWAK